MPGFCSKTWQNQRSPAEQACTWILPRPMFVYASVFVCYQVFILFGYGAGILKDMAMYVKMMLFNGLQFLTKIAGLNFWFQVLNQPIKNQ